MWRTVNSQWSVVRAKQSFAVVSSKVRLRHSKIKRNSRDTACRVRFYLQPHGTIRNAEFGIRNSGFGIEA